MYVCIELDDYQDWDNWTGNQDEDDEGPHCEDPGFNVSYSILQYSLSLCILHGYHLELYLTA